MAEYVLEWLRNCQITFIEDWPGNSPDFNTIEHLWSLLNRRLQRKDISTIFKLEAAIIEEWRNLDPQILKNLA